VSSLDGGICPSLLWQIDYTERVMESGLDELQSRTALDELFENARKYKTGSEYLKMLKFVRKFRTYSPFNAMLIYSQRPGARFVATAHRWSKDHGRVIKPAAIPIVILQPRGPVMFVFDVSDTEPLQYALPLPEEIEQPFEVRSGNIGKEIEMTIENALRDGVRVSEKQLGSQMAGSIQKADSGRHVNAVASRSPERKVKQVPLRYDLIVNGNHSRETRYVTMVHELGHLYCGHLGTPNGKWWHDRSHYIKPEEKEFEAESVAFLVCGRLGIDNPSESYLSGYLKENSAVPSISLDYVMKAAGLIEKMGKDSLPLRKEN